MSAKRNVVKREICRFLKIPLERISDSMQLKGIVPDSFMLVELLIELQEMFKFRLNQTDFEAIDTVGELTALIAQRAQIPETAEELYAPPG